MPAETLQQYLLFIYYLYDDNLPFLHNVYAIQSVLKVCPGTSYDMVVCRSGICVIWLSGFVRSVV